MSTQKKDVKFIIYQVLYIFVIVVLTMKGADIDLTKVLNKDLVLLKTEAVPKTYADSLKAYIDSLTARGLTPSIEIKDKPQDLADLRFKFGGYPVIEPVKGDILPPVVIPTEETNSIDKIEAKIDFQVLQPVQFTINKISNKNEEPLQVLADGMLIATIPPKSNANYTLHGEQSVTLKCGNTEKSIQTKPNQKPDISITNLFSGNENTSLKELQSVIGFRIIIKDDYPQYKVTISGPVKFEDKGNGVYDIKLMYAGSKQEFETRTANMEAPYRASFNVIVKDELAGHVVQRQGQYTFGGW